MADFRAAPTNVPEPLMDRAWYLVAACHHFDMAYPEEKRAQLDALYEEAQAFIANYEQHFPQSTEPPAWDSIAVDIEALAAQLPALEPLDRPGGRKLTIRRSKQ